MSEEQVNQTTPEPTAPTEAPEALPADTAVTEAPDWKALLEAADPKEVRAHPKIAGILGSEIGQRIWAERQKWETERQADDADREAQRQRQERIRLAKEDPYAFAERTLNDEERAETVRKEESALKQRQQKLTEFVGKAVNRRPEWPEIIADPKNQARLAEALTGKTDDEEILAAFNDTVSELIAEKRAEKRIAEWREKELAQEREAIRQEEAAKLLAKTASPGIKAGRGEAGKTNVMDQSPEEFAVTWEKIKQGKYP